MSNVWFGSDLHLGHTNMAGWRNFDSIEAHDQHWIDHWKDTVKKDDVVYLLGDMGSGGTKSTDHSLEIMASLPGRKRLIYGNHDPLHPIYYKDQHKWFDKFNKVYEFHTPYTFKKIGGRRVLLIHFPIWQDHTEIPRHGTHRMANWTDLRIHGHTHSDVVELSDVEFSVCPEAHNLNLVPLSTIEKWAASKG